MPQHIPQERKCPTIRGKEQKNKKQHSRNRQTTRKNGLRITTIEPAGDREQTSPRNSRSLQRRDGGTGNEQCKTTGFKGHQDVQSRSVETQDEARRIRRTRRDSPALDAEGERGDRHADMHRGRHAQACGSSHECRHGLAVGRGTYHRQPVCHAGTGRQPKGNRRSRIGKEPSEPRPRTVDRCLAAHQWSRHKETWSHTQGIQQRRPKALPQHALVAYPHRIAPPLSQPANRLRPQPHRRQARPDSTPVPAGDGHGIRRADSGKPLQSRRGVERCQAAGDARRAGLHTRQARRTQQHGDDRVPGIPAQANRRDGRPSDGPAYKANARQQGNRTIQEGSRHGRGAERKVHRDTGQARCTRQPVRNEPGFRQEGIRSHPRGKRAPANGDNQQVPGRQKPQETQQARL